MSEKEFVAKASGMIPLENAVMANVLKEGVSKILTVCYCPQAGNT